MANHYIFVGIDRSKQVKPSTSLSIEGQTYYCLDDGTILAKFEKNCNRLVFPSVVVRISPEADLLQWIPRSHVLDSTSGEPLPTASVVLAPGA